MYSTYFFTERMLSEEHAYCHICYNTVPNQNRFRCLNCPDWECCVTCESKADDIHPGHKLLHLVPGNVMPTSPYPKQWMPYGSVTCHQCRMVIIGPRYKCSKCPDFDLCSQCEADPSTSHQFDTDESHLFVKINHPIAPSMWEQSILKDHAQYPETPQNSDQNTFSMCAETTQDDDDNPPLPEDPFSGTGVPEPFDFTMIARAASQLVGVGHSVLSHPQLQSAAPVLRHITAFMAAFPAATQPRTLPKVDMPQLGNAIEQLVLACMKTPSSNVPVEQKGTSSQRFPDPEDAMVTRCNNAQDFEEALAENMRRLIESSTPKDLRPT